MAALRYVRSVAGVDVPLAVDATDLDSAHVDGLRLMESDDDGILSHGASLS
jgi:hypothetical protein